MGLLNLHVFIEKRALERAERSADMKFIRFFQALHYD